MIRFTRAQVLPIGLDLGHDSVKMLQLEQVGDSLSVVAAARQALPSDARTDPKAHRAALIDVVRQMLRRGGFSGRAVVAALPRQIVQVKNLRLPQSAGEELKQLVEFEARKALSFDPAEMQLRFLPAGEVRQGAQSRLEVILLAARNSDIADFLELLHACAVEVESLDVEPAALYRGIERFIRRREDEQEVHALIDIGATRTQVVIGRGRDITFIKCIEIGGRHFDDAVSRKLGITPDEAQGLRRRLSDPVELTVEADQRRDPVRQAASDATRSVMEALGREISLCLRYYTVTFRGHRPTRLRLMGGEACEAQLLALLKLALPLPIQVATPLYSIDSSRIAAADRRGTMAEWATAFGLSLKLLEARLGPRNGKPRDPNAPRHDLRAATTPAALPPASANAVAAAAPAVAIATPLVGVAPESSGLPGAIRENSTERTVNRQTENTDRAADSTGLPQTATFEAELMVNETAVHDTPREASLEPSHA